MTAMDPSVHVRRLPAGTVVGFICTAELPVYRNSVIGVTEYIYITCSANALRHAL